MHEFYVQNLSSATDVIKGNGHFFVGYFRDQETLLRNPEWKSVPWLSCLSEITIKTNTEQIASNRGQMIAEESQKYEEMLRNEEIEIENEEMKKLKSPNKRLY